MSESSVNKLAQALLELFGSNDPAALMVNSARYVTVGLAATITGFTQKAIRRKIESGVWIEQQEWIKAPDGHILIDMQGYERWAEKAAA